MSAIDYIELGDAIVVVERDTDNAWMWNRGKWKDEPELVPRCYQEGRLLDRDTFIRQHPFAAIELLDLLPPPEQS